MDNKSLSWATGILTLTFAILNFTVEDSGTLFLILAVISAIATIALVSKSKSKK